MLYNEVESYEIRESMKLIVCVLE